MTDPEDEIVEFQITVADEWISLARQTRHPKLQFMAYFASFNALYWLWGMFESWGGPEASRIDRLVAKLGGDVADTLLTVDAAFVDHLTKERCGIRRMEKRSRTDAHGDVSDGEKLRQVLADANNTPTRRAQALARALYQIRCNLVHGSKRARAEGDDNLVKRSLRTMETLAAASLQYTKSNRPR